MASRSKDGAQQEDPLKQVCDVLRSKQGVEYRTAVVLQDRFEYVRGKDLAAHLREKPDIIAKFTPGNKEPEARIKEFADLLLRRGILRRCERMYKKPRPGKKRLAKWPRKLLPVQDQSWSEEGFYAWQYERPTSPWTYVWSALMVVLVFAACCFPLAPYRVKLLVVYGSAALLILIFGTLLIRGVVALVSWIPTGTAFWIFPNMLADDLPITAAFTPVYSYHTPDKGTHWALRLGVLAVVASICSVLYTVSPGKGEVATGARQAHDALLDWLMSQPDLKSIAANETAGAGEAAAPPAAHEEGGNAEEQGGEGAGTVPPLEELLKDLGLEEEEEGQGQGQGQGAGEEMHAGAEDAGRATDEL